MIHPRAKVEQDHEGWRVTTTNNGFQWWGLGTIFASEEAAKSVVDAIHAALEAPEITREDAERAVDLLADYGYAQACAGSGLEHEPELRDVICGGIWAHVDDPDYEAASDLARANLERKTS